MTGATCQVIRFGSFPEAAAGLNNARAVIYIALENRIFALWSLSKQEATVEHGRRTGGLMPSPPAEKVQGGIPGTVPTGGYPRFAHLIRATTKHQQSDRRRKSALAVILRTATEVCWSDLARMSPG